MDVCVPLWVQLDDIWGRWECIKPPLFAPWIINRSMMMMPPSLSISFCRLVISIGMEFPPPHPRASSSLSCTMHSASQGRQATLVGVHLQMFATDWLIVSLGSCLRKTGKKKKGNKKSLQQMITREHLHLEAGWMDRWEDESMHDWLLLITLSFDTMYHTMFWAMIETQSCCWLRESSPLKMALVHWNSFSPKWKLRDGLSLACVPCVWMFLWVRPRHS